MASPASGDSMRSPETLEADATVANVALAVAFVDLPLVNGKPVGTQGD